MGVSEVYGVNLPEDIKAALMTVVFSFDEGSKVKKHNHPTSGTHFVTKGTLKASTNTESKTHEKGDFVIVPGEEECEIEAVRCDSDAVHIYWDPECPRWGST